MNDSFISLYPFCDIIIIINVYRFINVFLLLIKTEYIPGATDIIARSILIFVIRELELNQREGLMF